MCLCACIHVYVRVREREIYFKELAHTIVGMVSPKSNGVDRQAGDTGKSSVQVQRLSADRIPSCWEEISLCSIKVFTELHEALHFMEGNLQSQSSLI